MHVSNDDLSQCLHYLEIWKETGREEICLHFEDYTGDLTPVFEALAAIPSVTKLTFGTGDPYEGLIHYRKPHKDSALRRIKNLDFIRSMRGLTQVDLRGCCAIETLEALREMPNLKVVTLSDCPALHLDEALAPAESVMLVKLVDLQADHLRALQGMKQLGWLILRGCHEITSFEELGKLGSIIKLDVLSCLGVTSLAGLEQNRELCELDFHHCSGIRDASPLAQCVKLTKLSFDDCENLTNVTALHCLVNVRELLIKKASRVNNLDFLSAMRMLEDVSIRQCRGVSDITQIAALPRLKRLHLQECRLLENLSSLADAHELEELCIEGCWTLKDLSVVNQIPKLKKLHFFGVPEILPAEMEVELQSRLEEFTAPSAENNELWKWTKHQLVRNGSSGSSPSKPIAVEVGMDGVVVNRKNLGRATTRDELLALFGQPSRIGPSLADEKGPNSPEDWIWDHLGILVHFSKKEGTCTGIGFLLSFGVLDPTKEMQAPPYECYPTTPFQGRVTAYGQPLAWNRPGDFGRFEPLILRGELSVPHSHHGVFRKIWDYYSLTTQLGLYTESASGDLGVVTLVFNNGGRLPHNTKLVNDETLIGEFRECAITTRRLFVGERSWRLCDVSDLKREAISVPRKKNRPDTKMVIRVREVDGNEINAFEGDAHSEENIHWTDNARFDAAREVFLVTKAEYGAASASFVVPSSFESVQANGIRKQETQPNPRRLITCADCDALMAPSANACPNCGSTKTPNREPKKICQHPFSYFPAILQIIIAVIGGWLFTKLTNNSHEPLIPIAIMGAAIVISAHALWQILLLKNQLVQHSPKTFVYRQGVFDESIKVLNRNQIEMDIYRPFWGTVFGYGTLIVKTNNTELRFDGLDLSSGNIDDLLN